MTVAIDRAAVTAISTINTTAIPMIFRRMDRLIMFRALENVSTRFTMSPSRDAGDLSHVLSAKPTALRGQPDARRRFCQWFAVIQVVRCGPPGQWPSHQVRGLCWD